MSNIFIEIVAYLSRYKDDQSSVHTVVRERERDRERERERESVRVYEQRNKETPPTRLTSNPNKQLTNSNWQNSQIFIISKFTISFVGCLLTKLLRHLTNVSNYLSRFSFPQSNSWQDMNLFCLHLFLLSRDDSYLLFYSLLHALELSILI